MATVEAKAPKSHSPVIRRTPVAGEEVARSFASVLPAWVISTVIHAVLLALFFLVTWNPSGASDNSLVDAVGEARVEEPEKELDLTNTDLGIDSLVAKNWMANRIEDKTVIAPVTLDEIVNVPGPMDGTVMPAGAIPKEIGYNPTGSSLLTKDGSAAFITTPGSFVGMGLDKLGSGGFGARVSGATRKRLVAEGGGNAASEAAVARGLHWIAVHQSDDGHWSIDGFHQTAREKPGPGGRKFTCTCDGRGGKHDIAGTAFGLLPFLAAGITHKSTAENTVNYTKTVENGLKYLMSKQNKEGYFGGGMYEHGLASIALCEAYALSADPILKPHAQRALDFIGKAQHSAGGWRYSPGQAGDTSVVGWQVMALKSGQMAGLSVPKSVFDGAGRFLDSVQPSSGDGGAYGYAGPGAGPVTTSIGLLCRQYLGWTPRNPGLIAGAENLKKHQPEKGKPLPLKSMYFYYYATQVMHHIGGEGWPKWNEPMRDYLVKAQDTGANPKRPHQAGSWDPSIDNHGRQGGRLMVTSMALLTLEVYYRHLPLYRRDMGVDKDDK
jgi:hypothetical protein